MPLTGRQRLVITLGAVALATVVVVGAQRATEWLSPTASASSAEVAPDLRSSTDKQVAALQQYLAGQPNDAARTVQLGDAYLQKARESGDPAYYPRAEAAFTRALELDPNSFQAMVGMGSLAMSRHQFEDGLAWGKKAHAIAPKSSAVLGLLADALTDMGQYDVAVETVQAMVDLRPDQASYARVSYARELHGYLPEAIESMQQAVQAGAPHTEATAWTRVQLGHLYFNSGDLTLAQTEYQRALQEAPDYLHALAGLARVEAARGHYEPSIELYRKATATVPLAEYVIALGDVYLAAGRPEQAEEQYRLVEVIQTLNVANGVNMDLELAMFNLDRDRDLARTLAQVQPIAQRQPSVKALDTLAWALYKNGDCQGAQKALDRALSVGTRDSLLLFHAGLAAECLGDTEVARAHLEQAMRQNPHFSLRYAETARQTLARLYASGAAAAAPAERGS